MAHDVFICHSAKDKPTADAVCAMLESNGVRCWIAPRDVTAGMEWSECIIDAIEECRVMVLVFTTNANESGQIRREIERAVNRGVAILPLRLEDILPARSLEYFIGNVHWLDALTPPLETHLQNLAGTVKILLGRMPQHSAPIPHTTPQSPAPFKSGMDEVARQSFAKPTSERIHAEYIPDRKQEYEPQRTVAIPEPPYSPPAANGEQPAPRSPIGAPVVKRRWPPVGVIVVAVLGYIAAAGIVIGVSSDISGGHGQTLDLIFLIFASVDVAAGIGLMKFKWWGRALKILHSGVSTGFMLSIVKNPYNEGSASLALWVALVAYLMAVFLYMFNAHVKQIYRMPK